MASDEVLKSPEQHAFLLSYLHQLDGFGHPMVFGPAVVELCKMFGVNPLVEMEKGLRELKSNTYLVAMPFDAETAASMYARMPHTGDTHYPYYLYVCDSLEGAKEMLELAESTQEQNLTYLAQTGLLTPKKNTDLARQMHAAQN